MGLLPQQRIYEAYEAMNEQGSSMAESFMLENRHGSLTRQLFGGGGGGGTAKAAAGTAATLGSTAATMGISFAVNAGKNMIDQLFANDAQNRKNAALRKQHRLKHK